MAKIKKGDLVEMRKGKDRGKRGKVIAVRPKDGRIVVEGLNLVKKRRKPRRTGQKGEMVHLPRAVSIANSMIVCPSCQKPARVGVLRTDASRLRMCKRCKHEFA